MNLNFIWALIRLIVRYLSIVLRVLPLMYLVTPYLGEVSRYVLLPLFGEDEVLFRPSLFSFLMCALIQLISLNWFDALNRVIWFKSQEGNWKLIYRGYQYVFLVFGSLNLAIGGLIYQSYKFMSFDWFIYRDYLFWELLLLLCMAPCVLIYKDGKSCGA